jgi:H+/gluconate symporter-like permease
VKFARAEPAQTELKELHSMAHQLVDETRSKTVEVLTPEKSEEETAREAARRAALRLELEKRLLKGMILAICLMGVGIVMLFWSEVPFYDEMATGFRGDVLNPILEALCSKPVAIAVCVLGAVYLVEAAVCKARRLAL